MNENRASPHNLLDTTDCLEAVGVLKGWKNLLFIIMVLCILLLQACFWLVDTGWIPIEQSSVAEMSQGASSDESVLSVEPNSSIGDVNDSSEAALEQNEFGEPNQLLTLSESSEPNQPVEEVSETAAQQPQQSTVSKAADFLSGITFNHLVWVLGFVNAILILASMLYCLTLLFSLKVSMLGRLGGINHVTRAFFHSLLLLVLLLPWQRIFGSMVVGAVFTPGELTQWSSVEPSDILETTLYYLRFGGYWLLILLLLILAQIRSCRWANAILRRLEII